MSLLEERLVAETIYNTAYGFNNTAYGENHPTIEYYFRAPSPPIIKAPVIARVVPPETYNCCSCYAKDSKDSRCCGLCDKCFRTKENDTRCDWCPNNLHDYCTSGMIYTDSGTLDKHDESCGVFCVLCFPIKLSIFFPCCLGSWFNQCVNNCRGTNTNYLF
jgi:hypothetical protein